MALEHDLDLLPFADRVVDGDPVGRIVGNPADTAVRFSPSFVVVVGMPEVALVGIVVRMGLVASLVVQVDTMVVNSSVVFLAIGSDGDLAVFDDSLGDQIVGDLNTMSLLMGLDVFEGVCPYCGHFFGLLGIEIDIGHGIDPPFLLVVMMTFD